MDEISLEMVNKKHWMEPKKKFKSINVHGTAIKKFDTMKSDTAVKDIWMWFVSLFIYDSTSSSSSSKLFFWSLSTAATIQQTNFFYHTVMD